MKIFDHLWTRESKNAFRLIGLHQIGILVLAFNGGILLLFIPIFSFLFYPISVFSYEFGCFALVSIALSMFSFGYIVHISKTTFRYYEFYFFIPVLKIKGDLNELVIQRRIWNQGMNGNQIAIECQDDPWAELGFSDWVSIKKGEDEYHLGSNNNYEKVFETIKDAIYRLKNFPEDTSIRP